MMHDWVLSSACLFLGFWAGVTYCIVINLTRGITAEKLDSIRTDGRGSHDA
jgi:hypothetical protein